LIENNKNPAEDYGEKMENKPWQTLSRPASKGCLSKIVLYMSKIADPISRAGLVIACVMLAGMMFLTFFDVAGSMIGKIPFIANLTHFFKPILGSQEITELMMVILVSFALGYTALKKGHIRVDLLMQYTSSKVNRWLDIFTYGLSCIFYIFIAWQALAFALININDHKVSSVLMLPVYPFNILLAVGAALVVLILLRDLLQSIEEVRK
jgi:TRAP-type transport system small permease protein